MKVKWFEEILIFKQDVRNGCWFNLRIDFISADKHRQVKSSLFLDNVVTDIIHYETVREDLTCLCLSAEMKSILRLNQRPLRTSCLNINISSNHFTFILSCLQPYFQKNLPVPILIYIFSYLIS